MIDKITVLSIVLTAFFVSLLAYPLVLRFAKEHNIMDNPDMRKLQRKPVPVMGGMVVFLGITAAMLIASRYLSFAPFLRGFICMAIMFMVGVWDDIKNVPPTLRFIIEIMVVYAMMSSYDGGIQNLRGLWGIGSLSMYWSLPLSIVAGVGIINAINLIDGVDGYSSGFCIVASLLFAGLFYYVKEISMCIFALIGASALVPFFLHNLFGMKSKMFIGDSGTLMMGTAMILYVFVCLSNRTRCAIMESKGLCLVAFTLAVLAIPVFDTLRVMGARILRGQSPFQADKTHLHHLFIDMGFSHIGTTAFIVLSNVMIVVILLVSWKLGASFEVQLYIVIALGIMSTFGFYQFMRLQQRRNSGIYGFFCKLGKISHIERDGFWLFMRNLMDGRLVKKNISEN